MIEKGYKVGEEVVVELTDWDGRVHCTTGTVRNIDGENITVAFEITPDLNGAVEFRIPAKSDTIEPHRLN